MEIITKEIDGVLYEIPPTPKYNVGDIVRLQYWDVELNKDTYKKEPVKKYFEAKITEVYTDDKQEVGSIWDLYNTYKVEYEVPVRFSRDNRTKTVTTFVFDSTEIDEGTLDKPTNLMYIVGLAK